jgi:RNA polymerase sigma-70 factor (ECF subfamily)
MADGGGDVSAQAQPDVGLDVPGLVADDSLVRAAAGDPEAVRLLLDTAGPVVYGYVIARVGGRRSVADDLVQDTFLEAMRSAHTFRGESLVTTWLCAIARRRIARHFEAERRHAVADGELARDAAPWRPGSGSLDDEAAVVDQRDEVVRALGRLPVLHRQVLVRKYLDDCPVAEIADELGRTTVQVQSLLQRARTALRRELGATA